MNIRLITRYAKAHVALVGAILTWVIATFPGGQTAHYCSLAVGLLTAVGVFAVPNATVWKPSKSAGAVTMRVNVDTSQAKAAIAELAADAKHLKRRHRHIPAGSVTVDTERVSQGVRDRLALLPKPSARKHGAIPSPLDKRDYRAKLPSFASIPASVNYGLGLVFSMLLNNILGCCYPAALLHALQVLTAGKYVPTDADCLRVYEAMGYDPTKTDANGNNPTDRGTVGRVLFAWAKARGLIVNYAAVPTDPASIKAAIAAHKAVLCEWALPAGAENEGAKWTMPRANKAAGSWGYHATVGVGYTSRHTDNVTWGEEGTVTPPFERAYLQAAWIVTVAPGTDVAAIMAKVRAA